MKKTLLIMLAVLLLFSFVSCKDGSEEIIAVYEEYKTTASILNYAYNLIDFPDSAENVDYTVVVKDVFSSYFNTLLENKLGIEEEEAKIASTSGKIVGTYKDTEVNLEFKDVEIKYTVSESEKEKSFTLSGTYKTEITGESGKRVNSMDYNFKLNGKEYSLSYIYNEAGKKYSSAVVNGKNVELRLLNSTPYSAT